MSDIIFKEIERLNPIELKVVELAKDGVRFTQVIRCKDCEYGDTCEMGVPLDGSIRCDYHGDGYEIHDPYWFCADGKVKQNIIPDRV